jgi:hypothetical protein
MGQLSNEEIIQFFNSDISKYYNRENETWDESFLKFYWNNFSKYIELSSYKIENIYIPKCYEIGNEVLSDIEFENIIFLQCVFLDYVLFENLNFKNVIISNCTFKSDFNFKKCNIKSIEIKSIVVANTLTFKDCKIDKLLIEKGFFFKMVEFLETKIIESFRLDSLSVQWWLSFNSMIFNTKKESLITGIKTIDEKLFNFESYFIVEEFYQGYEKELESKSENKFLGSLFARSDDNGFSKFIKNQLIKEEYTGKREYLFEVLKKYFLYKRQYFFEPDIRFEDSLVMNQLTFYSINLKHFHFGNSNIENLKFLNCEWNVLGRLIIAEDKVNIGDQVENQYRQLKRIFNNEENWYMYSLAYISEMEVTKRKLGYFLDEYKVKYFSKYGLEYLIFQFYSNFGSYAQNYIRPLTIYILSTILIFPILYMFLEVNEFNVFSYPESLEKSISNSLPFISTELTYKSWSLKFIQILFSTIMLTFTIFGFRKRFKQ